VEFWKAWDLLTSKVTGWIRGFVLLLPNLLVAVLVLVAFWLLAKLARNVLHRLLRRVSHSEQVNRVLAQTAYVALIAAGLFVALGILGLQKTVASLLAGAGIIGLALGFAFQDIAANLTSRSSTPSAPAISSRARTSSVSSSGSTCAGRRSAPSRGRSC
jgi:small conductance mechanosensitive channel